MTTEIPGARPPVPDLPPVEVGEPIGLIAQLDKGFRDHDDSGVFVTDLGNATKLVCIRHPEDIRRVLVDSSMTKKPAFNGVNRVLGESLLGLETRDKRWPEIHAPTASALRRQHIISDSRLSIIMQAGNTFIDDLLDRTGGRVDDLEKEMTTLTFHTLGAVVLGRHANVGLGRLTHEESQDISATIAQAGGEVLSEGLEGEVNRLRDRLDELALETYNVATKEGTDEGTLLAELIHAGLPKEAILNGLITVMFAGRETTGDTLTWKEQLLKNRPGVLDRMQQEAHNVLKDGVPLTTAAFHELKYTRQVVEEVLRFMPPTPFIPRSPAQEVVIGDITAYPNDLIISSVRHAHRHPDYWNFPKAFNPDRFSPTSQDLRYRRAFMPFGLGERNCIGRNVAMTEMIVHAALFAKRVRTRVVSGRVAPMFDVALRPASPIQVEMELTA
jgi:cytochrome P450